MSGSRFDVWTRRRVGLAAGALAAARLGLADLSADARKRHKRRRHKKRCRKLGEPCVDGGRACCNGRTCGGDPALGTFCCLQGGETCNGDGDCCNRQCLEGACALN